MKISNLNRSKIFGRNFIIVLSALFLFMGNVFAENSGFLEDDKWLFWVMPEIEKKGGKVVQKDGQIEVTTPQEKIATPDGIQLIQHVKIEFNKKYRFKFKANTNKSGTVIFVWCDNTPPYKQHMNKEIYLTPEKEDYELDIYVKNTESNAGTVNYSLRFFANNIPDASIKFFDITLFENIPESLSLNWQVFLDVEPPANLNETPKQINNTNGKTVYPEIVQPKDNKIDLATLSGGFSTRRCAVLYNEFSSLNNGHMRIGFSADWWMEVYLNGKIIYSTMESGNNSESFNINDHIVDLPVRSGRNVLMVKVLSGSAGWSLTCGEVTQEKGYMKFTISEEWQPVNIENPMIIPGSA